MLINHNQEPEKLDIRDPRFSTALRDEVAGTVSDIAKKMNGEKNAVAENGKILLQILKGLAHFHGGELVVSESDIEDAIGKKIRLNQGDGIITIELID